MEIGEIVKAKAIEILSFGVKFKNSEELILVKSPDLSWYPGKLSDDESVKLGEEHEIKILHKLNNEYLGSLKDAKPKEDPWLNPPEVGSILEGIVSCVAEYGYLIRVQNILGLLHIDDAVSTYKIGQEIKVQVSVVQSENRRIQFCEINKST